MEIRLIEKMAAKGGIERHLAANSGGRATVD